jgi:hypothetical protein
LVFGGGGGGGCFLLFLFCFFWWGGQKQDCELKTFRIYHKANSCQSILSLPYTFSKIQFVVQ